MKYLDLKSIRREYNISQSELAKLTDYPQPFVSGVENQKRYATDEFIEKVVGVLHIEDITPYITDSPRKVIIHEKKKKRSSSKAGEFSEDTDSKAMIATLISVLEKCHEIIRAKDEEISRLRNALDEKYQEIAELLAQNKC